MKKLRILLFIVFVFSCVFLSLTACSNSNNFENTMVLDETVYIKKDNIKEITIDTFLDADSIAWKIENPNIAYFSDGNTIDNIDGQLKANIRAVNFGETKLTVYDKYNKANYKDIKIEVSALYFDKLVYNVGLNKSYDIKVSNKWLDTSDIIWDVSKLKSFTIESNLQGSDTLTVRGKTLTTKNEVLTIYLKSEPNIKASVELAVV